MNLTVTEITTSSISVNWTKPFGHLHFYKVHWTDANITGELNLTDTVINITNLTPGVIHEITVSAVAGDNYTEGAKYSVSLYTSKFKHNFGVPSTVTGID